MNKPTAETIVDAALETLLDAGFAGATSRAIARRGGFNQALIFYHHGSLEALLLAALRQTSEARLTRYREAVAGAATLDVLIPTMVELWEEDKAAGHVRVVSQMIAGSVNRPEDARRDRGRGRDGVDERRAELVQGPDRLGHRHDAPGERAVGESCNTVANLDLDRAELPRAVARAGGCDCIRHERDAAGRRVER